MSSMPIAVARIESAEVTGGTRNIPLSMVIKEERVEYISR
jgi:hypothetical protein